MFFSRILKSHRGNFAVVPPLMLVVALFIFIAGIASAQDNTVTDDDVNEIAGKLYCPVCENIPLDACGTAACADWRYEIRLQLEDGMAEQDVIDDFVRRFGDRVVGTPQDPTLRTLSLVTPYVAVIFATLLTIIALIRLQARHPEEIEEIEGDDASDEPTRKNPYRDLLEQDLS